MPTSSLAFAIAFQLVLVFVLVFVCLYIFVFLTHSKKASHKSKKLDNQCETAGATPSGSLAFSHSTLKIQFLETQYPSPYSCDTKKYNIPFHTQMQYKEIQYPSPYSNAIQRNTISLSILKCNTKKYNIPLKTKITILTNTIYSSPHLTFNT